MMIIIKSWFILITFLWPVTQRLTLNKAKQQLQSEFHRLLLRCSNPTTPIDVLNLIGPDEVLGIQRDDVGIPSPVLQELVSISTWCLEDHSSFGNGILNPLLHSLIEKWVKVTQMMPVFFSSSQEILRSLIGSLLLFCFFLCPDYLLEDIEEDSPLASKWKGGKRLKTCSLGRDTWASPHKKRAASWLGNKLKTRSLDRPPTLGPLPCRKEDCECQSPM